ncbi:unnamed protein product [Pylaiella littoralis]
MKGDVDPSLRLGVLSISPLPRNGGGTEASWVVEAKILHGDQEESEEEPFRTKPSRVGTWNEDLTIPLDAGDAQSSILQLNLLDATLREDGLKTCTFRLGDFVPWNGYHLDVHVGRDVCLRVSIIVALEDPAVNIQHILHLEGLLLTFPEGMPLPGVRREAGASVKSFIQCIQKGTEGNFSLQSSKTKEPPSQRCDAADEEVVQVDALKTDRNGGNSYLRNTIPVTIVEDQVAWNESIAFPTGPRVKKAYMSHTQAYPRQLYGTDNEWDICQVSFLVSFFLVEASSQNSSALGFAVLEIPDDVRLSDGGAELSANVTSPQGQTLEDVVCVVDIKASGPPPRPPRDSDASHVDDDDDKSDFTTSSTGESAPRSELSLSEELRSESYAPNSNGRRRSTNNSIFARKLIAKESSKHAEAEKELHSQIESVQGQLQDARAEADRKQTVVNSLSEQVDKRSDAIRKCGTEIVKLRKHIEDIDQDRCRLHSQLKTLHRTTAEAEMEANRIMKAMQDGHSAKDLDGDTGGRHTRALAKRCIVLTEENRVLRRVAQDCAHERWQTAVLKSEMEKMKKTQHVQAVYVRKMQALPGKVSAYKSTVSMQEKVIAKLEMLMAGRQPVNSAGTGDEADASLEGTKRGDVREIERLRKENASLRWKLATAGARINNSGQGNDDSARLKIKESKIHVLEEQMVANAKAAGDEIAILQARLLDMEFETGSS